MTAPFIPPPIFDAAAHYWRIGEGPAGQVYSSAAGAYVPDTDPGWLEFVGRWGSEPIAATEAEVAAGLALYDVPFLGVLAPVIETRPRVVRARLRIVAGAVFSVAVGVPRAIPWSAAPIDPLGMHQAPANPERIVIPAGAGGWYSFTLGVRWSETGAGANVGYRAVQLARGLGGSPQDLGTQRVASAPSGDTIDGFTEYVQLSAGDVLRAFVAHGAPDALGAQARLNLVREE